MKINFGPTGLKSFGVGTARFVEKNRAYSNNFFRRSTAGGVYYDFTSGSATGVSCSRSGTVATYINSSGVLVTAGADVPRVDYSSGTASRLLCEPASANLVRNNTLVGASAGTPGVAPTNWTLPGSVNGLTTTKGLPGQINGVDSIDLRYVGTATGTALIFSFETTTGAAATAGKNYSHATFVALSAGSLANVTSVNLRIIFLDSGGATLATTAKNITTGISSVLSRQTMTQNAPTGTAFIRPQITVTFSAGAVLDFTLRIGLPQSEEGPATSPIRTSGVAVTRPEEFVWVPGLTVSAPTTILSRVTTPAANYSADSFALALGDGSADYAGIKKLASSTSYNSTSTISGVDSTVGARAASLNSRVGFCYDGSNFYGGITESNVIGGAATLPGVLDKIYLGSNGLSGSQAGVGISDLFVSNSIYSQAQLYKELLV